jgi:hypothetical protein
VSSFAACQLQTTACKNFKTTHKEEEREEAKFCCLLLWYRLAAGSIATAFVLFARFAETVVELFVSAAVLVFFLFPL